MARLCLALLLAAAGLVLLPSSPAHPSCAWAAGSSHAALVVEHGNGQVLRYCVGFDGASVTGEQLLQLARQEFGLEYGVEAYGGLGDAVCQVDNEPASYPPQPPGCLQNGPYWSLWVSRAGGAWTGSNRGVSTQTFGDGDAEGWHWTANGRGAPPAPGGTCAAPPAATAAPPAPAAASEGGAETPTAAPAVAATPGSSAAAGPAAPSASPSASPSPALARPAGAGTPGPNAGIAAAAAMAGAMIGLAFLRLVAPRLGRGP